MPKLNWLQIQKRIQKQRKLKKEATFAVDRNLYVQMRLKLSDEGEVESVWTSWLFRYKLKGQKQREMGLGALDDYGLGEMQEKAREYRRLLKEHIDPIEHRDTNVASKQAAEKLAAAKMMPFKRFSDSYIAQRESEWKNQKHKYQWRQSLEQFAYPTIGDLAVSDIDTTLVLNVLKPIWLSKTETAARLRGRIENILDAAKAEGYRTGDNPAAWGNLKHLLTKPAKAKEVAGRGKPQRALPHVDLPAFMKRLRQQEGEAARALEFTIATAARTSEVTGARWSEINFGYRDREEGKDGFIGPVWTIPPERMKAGRSHTVPLPPAVAEFLRKRKPADDANGFIFPGGKRGRALSNMAMLSLLQRRMDINATVHGFRAAFRTWAAEETDTPRDIAEAALAHIVGDKTERAYQRGERLKKRHALMCMWQAFIDGQPISHNVVLIPTRVAS